MKQLKLVGRLYAIFVKQMVTWDIFNTNLTSMGEKARRATHQVAKAQFEEFDNQDAQVFTVRPAKPKKNAFWT